MNLLVTGGAGYVGSVVAHRLRDSGHRPIILDDLSEGHREAVEGLDLVVGDIGDRALIEDLVRSRQVEGAVHLAASASVEESVRDPAKYYRNNLQGSLALLDALRKAGVGRFVLSSTAAVYGEPVSIPIDEEHPTRPTHPYGETKLALETALRWYAAAYGFVSVSLRYFNAAGAAFEGRVGEDHEQETHLVPNVLRSALTSEPVVVFGTDYPTPDGSAVRDYVHVEDLAEAHVRALDHLDNHGGSSVFNLGNGRGVSVLQVIEAARRVTGRTIRQRPAPRRSGDPATLVASSEKARRDLGWSPRFGSLETILESAWKFALDHPHGYRP